MPYDATENGLGLIRATAPAVSGQRFGRLEKLAYPIPIAFGDPLVAIGNHRGRRAPKDLFRHGSHEDMFQVGAPLGAHDDHVYGLLEHQLEEFVDGVAHRVHGPNAFGRQAAVADHLIQETLALRFDILDIQDRFSGNCTAIRQRRFG